MSKETTAKGIDIVRKNVSETHQEVLRTLGVLDERGLFALEVDEGIKTVAATPVDANKVQVLAGALVVAVGIGARSPRFARG